MRSGTIADCLVRRPHYSARLMRFGSRGPSEFSSQIRHPITLTEKAWEDAVQGLGMAMSTVASEKNRELLQGIVVYRQCVYNLTNSDISACCFTSISRARPPENRKY